MLGTVHWEGPSLLLTNKAFVELALGQPVGADDWRPSGQAAEEFYRATDLQGRT